MPLSDVSAERVCWASASDVSARVISWDSSGDIPGAEEICWASSSGVSGTEVFWASSGDVSGVEGACWTSSGNCRCSVSEISGWSGGAEREAIVDGSIWVFSAGSESIMSRAGFEHGIALRAYQNAHWNWDPPFPAHHRRIPLHFPQ